MKKEQKIIKIRTSAKVKLENLKAEMKTAIAIAAQTHADILAGRTDKCDNERFNEIERFKAEKLTIEADFYKEKAALYAETEMACKEATDDPEQETETDNDVTVQGFQHRQETVYCDGSEHSARIVARRLINKMPHIPINGYLNVNVVRYACGDNQEYFVSVFYGDGQDNETEVFSARRHTAELEAAFMEKARRLFAEEPESGNSHVAEPMASALDAVFGGNPVEEFDNLISDTVKDRKEGENE